MKENKVNLCNFDEAIRDLFNSDAIMVDNKALAYLSDDGDYIFIGYYNDGGNEVEIEIFEEDNKEVVFCYDEKSHMRYCYKFIDGNKNDVSLYPLYRRDNLNFMK